MWAKAGRLRPRPASVGPNRCYVLNAACMFAIGHISFHCLGDTAFWMRCAAKPTAVSEQVQFPRSIQKSYYLRLRFGFPTSLTGGNGTEALNSKVLVAPGN